MAAILEEIQSGEFAREWIAEGKAGAPHLQARRDEEQRELIEQAGADLRSMMPFLEPKAPPT